MADAGLEVIVGVNDDKVASLCLAPVSKTEALAMVNSLQSTKLLQRYWVSPHWTATL